MAITRNRYDYSEDIFYQGLSTDTKPTDNVALNAIFWELDTDTLYYYNGTSWVATGA